MSSPNPEVIRWARETAGLGLTEAAKKLGIKSKKTPPEEILLSYETGVGVPSRTCLLAMSKHYHRPYLTFFLRQPPKVTQKGEDFRTVQGSSAPEYSGAVDALVRDIFVRQSLVKEALVDLEEDKEIPFVSAGSLDIDVKKAATIVSRSIKFNLADFRQQSDPHEAFGYLRNQCEAIGIYVLLIGDLGSHHTSLGTEFFRGFALSDPIAPFIVINDNDSKSAWCFTLLHELVHLWIGKTGISSGAFDNKIEKYCNDVASYVLASDEEIYSSMSIGDIKDKSEFLSHLSSAMRGLNVSGSLIIYRLHRSGVIDKASWEAYRDELKQLWLDSKRRNREKSKGSAGNYYFTKRHKVGKALIRVVRQSINEGVLSETKASKVLGVSSCSVNELIGV